LFADVGERAGRQYDIAAVFDLVGDVTHAERVGASAVGRVVAGKTVRDDDNNDENDNGDGCERGLPRLVQRRRRIRATVVAVDWTDCARPLGKLSQTAGRT